MASLLRQIVAGPRARHPEAGLDLCYVTDNIIATSGPSSTYPQRAYRNPTDSLVRFLDLKHQDKWAIWEFRAEGTGYPDSEVYNRIWHFPWPDHHPPPFALIPNIMASMRNWLKGDEDRVVVVHCKAGKGRSGTISVSYLVAEEGWSVEEALRRFTERRMRPGFGAGVSIPSQLRWITYVERWKNNGKIYVERQVEILEVHVWGLRDGVKVSVEGFVEEGKKIKTFHTFERKEREIVRGAINTEKGFSDVVFDAMGRKDTVKKGPSTDSPYESSSDERSKPTPDNDDGTDKPQAGDVVFRPSKRVVLPTNDVNVDFERRNKATYGWTMVTAVAHVWFNTFFEGQGPEKNGDADASGVFELDWEKLDGIKGSSRKGTRAFDKVAVVWKVLETESPPVVIHEPCEGEEVKQPSAADWKGENERVSGTGKALGLRASSPASTEHSRASSVNINEGELHGPDEDADHLSVKAHGPRGETTVKPPEHPLPLATDLPSPVASTVGLDGTYKEQDPSSITSIGGKVLGEDTIQSPEPADTPVQGLVSGMQHVGTATLPGGKPEDDMKDAKEHTLGQLKKKDKEHTG